MDVISGIEKEAGVKDWGIATEVRSNVDSFFMTRSSILSSMMLARRSPETNLASVDNRPASA